MSLRIFKFQDHTDFNAAYVIAINENRAGRLIRRETHLSITVVDSRPLDDFPKAMEHYDFHGESVWINMINPF